MTSRDGIVVTGRVQKGEGLGSKMGFPTANLPDDLAKENKIKDGLYAAWATIGDDEKRLPAIFIVGVPYKLKKGGHKVEVYIIDYDHNIRGRLLNIDIVKFVRPILEFSSVDDMVEQIKMDLAEVKKVLNL